jgi:hypothetical protein
MGYSKQANNIRTMAQTGKISLKLKSQTPKTEQELFNALAERLVKGEITATQASEEFNKVHYTAVGFYVAKASLAAGEAAAELLMKENEELRRELATLRRVSETLYAKREEENMELEARNDFIIDLLTEDQVEELMARDKQAEEDEIRDTRRTEFLKWQMELMTDYKAGKFTHAEGMRMMKEKYPEFYPDSSDEEEEEDDE